MKKVFIAAALSLLVALSAISFGQSRQRPARRAIAGGGKGAAIGAIKAARPRARQAAKARTRRRRQ